MHGKLIVCTQLGLHCRSCVSPQMVAGFVLPYPHFIIIIKTRDGETLERQLNPLLFVVVVVILIHVMHLYSPTSHPCLALRSTFSPSCLPPTPVPVPLMPAVNLTPHTFAIRLVFYAVLNK